MCVNVSYTINSIWNCIRCKLLSRFSVCYLIEHWKALKRMLRYLRGTIELGIFYKRQDQKIYITAYSDVDYAADLENRRSTSGYVLIITRKCLLGFTETKCGCITESEYIAATLVTKELVWFQQLLNDFDCPHRDLLLYLITVSSG